MDVIIQNIQDLIGQNNISGALDLFKIELHKYLSLRQRENLKLIEQRFNKIIDEELGGTISPEDAMVEKAKIAQRLLNLMNLLQGEKNVSQSRFDILYTDLIRNNSYPFLKRTDFRRKVLDHFDLGQSQVLIIEGGRESGMSYLEQFLLYFSELNKDANIKIITINVERILNNPQTINSLNLLEILIEKIGHDSTEAVGENIKFIRFENALRQKIDEKKILPLFFFHDFHKATIITKDVYNLIYELMKIQSNCLFIFSGLDYNDEKMENWDEVQNSCEFYTIPNNEITKENIEDCFRKIYAIYNLNITRSLSGESISFEDYYESIKKNIFPDGEENINISYVGNKIKDHLVQLKRY